MPTSKEREAAEKLYQGVHAEADYSWTEENLLALDRACVAYLSVRKENLAGRVWNYHLTGCNEDGYEVNFEYLLIGPSNIEEARERGRTIARIIDIKEDPRNGVSMTYRWEDDPEDEDPRELSDVDERIDPFHDWIARNVYVNDQLEAVSGTHPSFKLTATILATMTGDLRNNL